MMKSRIWTCIRALAMFVTMTAWLPLVAQNQPAKGKAHIRYVVKDLGTVGGSQAVAEGISDRGWIVGTSEFLPGDLSTHAALWRNGLAVDLGTLGGTNSQEQWPVNDNRGLIVGTSEISKPDPFQEDFCNFAANGVPPTGLICLGFFWENGLMTPLPALGGNNSYAAAVNNRGQAVGWAENSTQDTDCNPPQTLDFEAVIWGPRRGQIRQLDPLPGDTVAEANGINDREQVIGVSGVCSDSTSHGVLWHNGTVTDLGNLGGVLNTEPYAINSHGFVVGNSDLMGDTTFHAFIWNKEEGMRDIGTLPGDSASLAFGTNESDQVVGGSCVDTTFNNCRAFLWQNGVMVDVNSLVPPGSTPLYLFFGNDINDRGEIAAFAVDLDTGLFRAALAVPCDEKETEAEGCKSGVAADEPPRIMMPDDVREQLLRRLLFRRAVSSSQ